MRALVTGATGFVGTALRAKLTAAGIEVVPAVRSKSVLPHEVVVGNLDALTDWHLALAGCDAVVHLAARVHVMDDTAQNLLALYQATNPTNCAPWRYQLANYRTSAAPHHLCPVALPLPAKPTPAPAANAQGPRRLAPCRAPTPWWTGLAHHSPKKSD